MPTGSPVESAGASNAAQLDPFDPNTWSEDQRHYFNRVDQALRDEQSLLISNGKTEHAVFLAQRFLSNAEDTVRLFSGRLSRRSDAGFEIYANPNVIDATKNALRRGVKILIVLHEEIDAEGGDATCHPLAQAAEALRAEGSLKGIFLLLSASEDSIELLRENCFLHHWMTMDDRAYRLEFDIENAKAHVNFGDQGMVSRLNSIFDDLLFSDAATIFAVTSKCFA